MSDTERGYVPHNPNGPTNDYDALVTGERECVFDDCDEKRYTVLGREFHILREHGDDL